jgi:hypothetical protein
MDFAFLNPWMLAGLAGVALPILVHLLSRKRYDVVDWGAMQFLELDPNARRRLRLEDLLLLLMRMGLIALLALAFARPWISGAWLGRYGSHQSRDVAIVLDGSYSMGWQGENITPDRAARQAAQALISGLYPGDTVAVLDARDRTRLVIGPTRDLAKALQALEDLPPPSGTSQLSGAVLQAVQVLSRATNLQRDVVVFSDRQAKAWQADDPTAWKRLDDMRALATVPPRLWAYDASTPEFGRAANVTVDRLQLSREVAVPDVPLRVKTNIRQTGGTAARGCKVYLSVDGVRLNDQTVQVRLPAHGETSLEFEPRFTNVGSHLVTVSVDADPLPADDRSDAVVVVRDGLPVLLVNGAPSPDPVRNETFFAEAALSSALPEKSWIRATVKTPAEVDLAALSDFAVIVLANVPALSDEQSTMIDTLVSAAGRAVLVTCGDRIVAEDYNTRFAEGRGWFPCRLQAIAQDTATALRGVHVSNDSLELPWLKPFRSEEGGSLAETRFAKWWKIDGTRDATDEPQQAAFRPMTVARLNTGDPWLVIKRHGRGRAAVLTSTLDADWNTLPAKPDYVPWLHELLFYLAQTEASRNVEPGQPLLLEVPQDLAVEEYAFVSPVNERLPAEPGGDEVQRWARLSDPVVPGVYRFEPKAANQVADVRPEYFVVQTDRGESDLTPLTDAQRTLLMSGNRLTFVQSLDELLTRMTADESRAEIWWVLLYLLLALLVWETWFTRRLVRGGQAVQVPQEDAQTIVPLSPEGRTVRSERETSAP